MRARGRNGWFKPASCLIRTTRNVEDNETETTISFYSRRKGNMPPIMLIGTRQESESMLVKILHALDSHMPNECEVMGEAVAANCPAKEG